MGSTPREHAEHTPSSVNGKVIHADFAAASDEELRRRASEGDRAALTELNRRRALAKAWMDAA